MRDRKDTFLFLITKIITGIIGVVSISLQTKFLSTTDVGNYSLINGVVTALVSVMIGWIGSSSLRYYYSKGKEEPNSFHTTIIIDWFVMIICSCLIMFLVGWFSDNLPIRDHLLFSLFFLVFAGFMEIMEKMLRASKHTKVYCFLLIVESIINIVFILSFNSIISSGVDLLLILRIINASLFTIAGFITLKFYKYIRFNKFSFKLNNIFFKYGFPMVGIWGVGWLLSYSDRYIINMYLSPSDVGLYDVAYVFSERTIGVVVAAFGLAFFPMLIRVWKDEGKDSTIEALKQSLNYYFIFSIPMCVGIGMLSYYFYGTLLDKSFSEAYFVMPITCAGFFLSGINNFLYKMWQLEEKTGKVLIVTTIAVVINIGLNFLLIPIYGYIAAAITTTASYFVAFVITFIIIKRKFGIKIDFVKLIKIIVASTTMCLFLLLVRNNATNIYSLIFIVLNSIAVYFLVLFAFGGLNDEINELKLKIGKKHENKK